MDRRSNQKAAAKAGRGGPFVHIVGVDGELEGQIRAVCGLQALGCATYATVDALLTESLCPQEACIVLQADAQAPFDSTALEDLVVRTWPAPVILIAPRPKLEWAIDTVRGGVHTVVEEPVEREHLQRCIAGALQACRARLQQQMERKQERARFDKLTPREMEVTSMLLQGLNSREIARELKLSVKTVEVHRNHIRQKTAVRTFPELVLLAQRCGLWDGHGNASDSWNARPP